jgi:hypothetical protein
MPASPAALCGRLDSRIEALGHLLLRVVSSGFVVAHGWPRRAAVMLAIAPQGGGPWSLGRLFRR